MDRRVRRCAKRAKEKRDLFRLDQPAHLLDGLWRAVGVVEADESDLAPVDPALFVDHLEIGGFGATNHTVGGERPAIGHGLPDLDFRVGDAWGVLCPRGPEALGGIRGCGRSRKRRVIMLSLPMMLLVAPALLKSAPTRGSHPCLGTFFTRAL